MRWPVIPLARPVQLGAHPVEDGQIRPSRDAATLSAWWARAPYNVGLPTGCAFDVLDVPVGVGAVALGVLRATGSMPGPVLNVGDRYQFLVRPGASTEVDNTLDDAGLSASELKLRYRGRGDVLVAPPSTLPRTTTHWVIEPDLARPQLPDALAVLPELVRAGLRTVRVNS